MNTIATARQAALALVIVSAGTAQVQWVDRSPDPVKRLESAMAYDVSRGVLTLFSGTAQGFGAYSIVGDTWERQNGVWRQHVPATSPPARRAHALAHDPIRRKTVLFGGTDTEDFGGESCESQGLPPRSYSGNQSSSVAPQKELRS